MGDIRFHCPFCQNKIVIDDKAAGFFAKCPHCAREIQIPQASEQVPPRVALPGGLAEIAAQRDAAEQRAAKANEAVIALERQLESVEASLRNAQRELEDMRAAKPAVIAAQEHAAARIAELEKETARLSSALASAEEKAGRAESLELEKKAADERATAFQVEISALQQKLAALQRTAQKQADAHIEQLRLDTARLAAELKTAQEQAARDMAELQRQIAQAENAARQKDERITSLQQELEKMRDAATTKQAELQKMAQRASEMEKENARLAAALTDAEQKIAAIPSADLESNIARKTLEDAAARVPALQNQVHVMAEAVKAAEQAAARAQAEADRLRKEMADRESEFIAAKQAAAKWSEENERLRKSAASAPPPSRTEPKRIVKWTEPKQAANVPAAPTPRAHTPAAVAPLPASPGPHRRRMLIPLLVALLLVGAGVAILLYQRRAELPGPGGGMPLAAATGGSALDPVALGAVVLVDGMNVKLERAAIRPVQILNSLGNERPSSQPYLALEMLLENTTTNQTVVLLRTWEQARLTDNLRNNLAPAFSSRFSIEQSAEAKVAVEVPPGEMVRDTIVFPVPVEEAESFTLSADPGFWRKTPEDRYVPISSTAFKITFRREDFAAP